VQFDFLADLVVVFAVGGLVVYALRAVKLPAIVGLLIAGALIGPHGASLVADAHEVEVLAEIGVVLLLFTIGLEFSLAQLARMWKAILGAGGGQVLLTIALVAGLSAWHGDALPKGVFLGFLAALSSTAIVLRLLGDRSELAAPYGRVSLGILLFQDLCIVPLMLLTPFLAGRGSGSADLALTLLKAAAVVVGVVVAARKLVPPVLLAVVRTRSRELFLTLLLVLCLGTAWLTSLAGLSLALGAFLAGLAISESEFSHQAMAEAIPFRDAFGSLFFVSIGMLMDAGFVVKNLPLVAVVVVLLLVVKSAAAIVPSLLMGYPLGVSVKAGLALAQIGEFAFVLSRSGLEMKLISDTEYQVFLSASVISMLLTPALLLAGNKLAAVLPAPTVKGVPVAGHDVPKTGHVIVAGYGVNGQNLARALSSADIPYAILEMNPETVRSARERGEPISYGDCTKAPILEALGVAGARLFVVAISDAASVRQSVSLARSMSSELYIVVRTRFVSEVDELHRLGANEVIPEEFETSVEIFARVLDHFEVPRNVILDLVGRVRGDEYGMLRGPRPGHRTVKAVAESLAGVVVERLWIRPGSPLAGSSLGELDLRQRTGASVIGIQRGSEALPNPGATADIREEDILLVMGDDSAINRALTLLDGGG
jgi:CPA2 family monovalent cation:H+ antiporter-2